MKEVPVSCDSEKPAKLVRSMHGGKLLVYKCADCGQELFRSPEQAEYDAVKSRVEDRVVQDEHILRRLQ